MADFKRKAEQKIRELLDNICGSLLKYPILQVQQRELLPEEYQIISNLPPDTFLSQIFQRLLTIETYITTLITQMSTYQQLNGMLASTLQSLNQLKQTFPKNTQKILIQKCNNSTQQLVKSIKIFQKIFLKSQYISIQNNLINSMKLDIKIQDEMLIKLRNQNQQLHKKSQQNQTQIINLQTKLTNLLKQHQTSNQPLLFPPQKQTLQLRQQLLYKQQQIQKMNKQFTFEIQKYNTVFQTLRRQLDQFKSYENVNLIEKIQLLQTNIVRLRQENQLNQIIIKQLRNDNMFNNQNLFSPKHSNHRLLH